jgi:hypothetical protein
VRTTINLEDDVLRRVKRYAAARRLALGRAVSELVRRGFASERPTRVVNGLRVPDLPPGSPRVTTKRVRELQDEPW